MYDSALPTLSKVSSVVDGNLWRWPVSVTLDLMEIQANLPSLQVNRDDCVKWLPSPTGNFPLASAWEVIRGRQSVKDWFAIVWFTSSIPRHCFILWLAIQDRLATLDRLLSWGVIANANCVLCNQCIESRDHLFFNCLFSSKVWKQVLRLCCVNRTPRYWANEFIWAKHSLRGKSFCSIIKKLAWASTIYNIWRERNSRIHNNSFLNEEGILKIIMNDIRLKAASFECIKDNDRNRTFCNNWNISCDILS